MKNIIINTPFLKPHKNKTIETSTKAEEDLNNRNNLKNDNSTKSKSFFLLQDSDNKLKLKLRAKSDEFDLKDEEIEELERFANIEIISNIGYGGFSTVKLIYSLTLNKNYAMKVVRILLIFSFNLFFNLSNLILNSIDKPKKQKI